MQVLAYDGLFVSAPSGREVNCGGKRIYSFEYMSVFTRFVRSCDMDGQKRMTKARRRSCSVDRHLENKRLGADERGYKGCDDATCLLEPTFVKPPTLVPSPVSHGCAPCWIRSPTCPRRRRMGMRTSAVAPGTCTWRIWGRTYICVGRTVSRVEVGVEQLNANTV